MKTHTVIMLAIAGAAIITFAQWYVVIPTDNFTGLPAGPDRAYKVFRYGFPFAVVEGTPGLPIATPEWQTPWRIMGNFLTFLFAGLFVAWVVRLIRKRNSHHEVKIVRSAI